MLRRALLLLALAVSFPVLAQDAQPDAKPIQVLFLGDKGHHQPEKRFADLQPALAKRGIELTYTENVNDLNPDTLGKYAGLLVYANIDTITAEQEAALLQYVESGHGFIPLHCASFCFRNSKKYVELVGAQFQRHGTGTFRTLVTEPDHPLLKGFKSFESWDETYVHTMHNEKDRTVLEIRKEGDRDEPWTWVRTQGKGRVFYTAWGHDQRTFQHPGFHNLVERGIRWAVGADLGSVPTFADKPEMTTIPKDVKPFEFVDATIPFYPASPRWGTLGEPLKKMQKPLPPEESIKHFVTPVGFQVELFVSEPDLQGKPIAMNWDERGRCWVCETVDYPNEMQREGEGRDRIRICEDTNGDGKADRFTVFADKLSIPTSLIFARGGVIIHQAPHTIFLKDTNGDDVADDRQVLFTGWNTSDTHAGPSNLVYGHDNWIYGMVGYAGFRGTVGGEQVRFQTGFYRFKPDGSKLEFLRNTNNNSWGVGISEEGYLFGSTANGCPSVFLPIPNRYYEQVRGWSSTVLQNIAPDAHYEPITEKVREVDHHGNFTAAAGHALYTARTYPQEYWNRTAFITDPTGHLVSTFALTPDGAGFKSKYSWNLLASDDEWSAPIMAEVGPDGNVWVIDWYNFIVQHNPTPRGYQTGRGNAYETELRDKKHGRIYRVVYKDAPKAEAVTLKDATPEKLVETLKHDNLFWRRHAQRLLVERGQKDVVPALQALIADRKTDAIGMNGGAVHAMNVLQALGANDDQQSVTSALSSPSAAVRKAAVMALPSSEAGAKVLIFGSSVLQDPEPQVRLAALLKIAEIELPFAEGSKFIKAVGNDPVILSDRALSDAATAAFARHDTAALIRGGFELKPETQNRYLAILERVAEHFARRSPPEDELNRVLHSMYSGVDGRVSAIIRGLARGWPRDRRVELDKSGELALVNLFKASPSESRGQLAQLASRMGSKVLDTYSAEIAESFLTQAKDDKASETTRMAGASQFMDLRKSDAEAVTLLLDLITPRTSPELSRGLLEAVGKSDVESAGSTLLDRVASMTPALRPVVFKTLLSRADWTEALLTSLEAGGVQPGDLSLEQKQALMAHPDRKLAERSKTLLAKIGALPSADRQKVYDELVHVTQKKGDAALGKEAYKKHCSKCHIHGTEGTRIGPDLTGMAVHPKAELLTNVLDPSRSVEGNFKVYNVALIDGRTMSGMLLSETKTSIELVDTEAKKHTILREDIEELIASSKSLMPEGFEKTVTVDELTNLLEFLAQRGKYLPIPLDKAATVVSTKGMFFEPDGQAERLVFRDWSPKTFEGVPFQLVDPQGDQRPNAILLYGPQGRVPPTMPKSVMLPCNAPAKTIHFLSGVSGWGFPIGERGSVSMIVRLHYADESTEDHELKNGEHFADYIRRVDVPGSKFAYSLRGQQLRYLTVTPRKPDVITKIELVKGRDDTAPIVMAVTVEGP